MNDQALKNLSEFKMLPEVKMGKIFDALEKDLCPLICLFCILPFLQPLPLHGLSLILGIIIFLQGIGLIFWNKPLIFKQIRDLNISPKKMASIYNVTFKLNWLTTKFSAYKHPIVNSRWSHFLSGIAIVFLAAVLLLPLPLPLSNFLPSIGILFISIGMLEDDLILISLGYGLTSVLMSLVIFSYNIIIEQLLGSF
jgi:hypothetical protein